MAEEPNLCPVVGATHDSQDDDQDGLQGMAPDLGVSGIIDHREQDHRGREWIRP